MRSKIASQENRTPRRILRESRITKVNSWNFGSEEFSDLPKRIGTFPEEGFCFFVKKKESCFRNLFQRDRKPL
ncbi:hypothetical protein DLM78_20670 [Leptospira stimsonii]|uniref:Uncharacterized protein n=1 Tax=Leptospira stimsonii TaxID=2202203 RepID=A0A8B3CMW0_9LEPT|nr:hypothetical protein DLM78_20670 [Leptospira stimsonii]